MGFSDDLKRVCIAAGEKAELVVRRTALELQSQMVEMSPVGNPDTWEANKAVIYQRETHNLFVEAMNADADKTGGRRTRKMGKDRLKDTYKLKAGDIYTGGRFKNNWQVGIGFVNTDTSAPPSASGSAVEGRARAVLASWKPGQTIFLTNSMPYAKRLEHGWSKQAPGGMVRLTVQAYAQALKTAVESIK